MSWVDFLPENIQDHPSHFAGPNVAGVIFQCLETGILMNQSVHFWSRSETEPRVVKLLVAFVSSAASFQTVVAIYNTWRVVVLGFGDLVTLVDLGWPDRIQPALNCVMAAPFQAFLIWRCWNVLQRRWFIVAPLAALLIATVIMNVYITIDVFFSFDSPAEAIQLSFGSPPHSYITAFVLTATLDILITALMMYYLLRVQSQAVSRRFAKTVARLHRLIWEAAIPPCACAISACVVYITMSEKNLWDIFLQSILGKLYVISLFVILNGSADLKRRPTAFTPSSEYWASGAPVEFRVELTSVVDRHDYSDMEHTPDSEAQRSNSPISKPDHSLENIPAHDRFYFEMGRAEDGTLRDTSLARSPVARAHRSMSAGDLRLSS